MIREQLTAVECRAGWKVHEAHSDERHIAGRFYIYPSAGAALRAIKRWSARRAEALGESVVTEIDWRPCTSTGLAVAKLLTSEVR